MTKFIQYLIGQTLWVMCKCSKGLHIGCLTSPLEEVFIGKWFSFSSQNKLTLVENGFAFGSQNKPM